jgi:hypothetical protein
MSAVALPLECFQFRCWARAYLFMAGELSLHEAVDELQAGAQTYGLVAEIGQDEVQRVMAAEIGRYRDDLLVGGAPQHDVIQVEATA